MDTWDEIERMWLQAQHGERTRRSYSFAWRDFQAWSQKYPSDITVKDVVEYRDKLLKAGLSQATARVRLSAVKCSFLGAMRQV